KSRADYGLYYSKMISIFEQHTKNMEKLKENRRLEKEESKILIEKEKGEVRFKIVENMKCFKEN
ncbi:hypothetical protein N8201_04135, partial [Polaribacter sp.]|nr:hypothetical protein [Polaribacter sp.]